MQLKTWKRRDIVPLEHDFRQKTVITDIFQWKLIRSFQIKASGAFSESDYRVCRVDDLGRKANIWVLGRKSER